MKNDIRGLCDCHNHTEYSHDSTAKAEDMCKSAIEKGLSAIAFTDHCDVEYRDHMDIKTPIVKAAEISRSLAEKYEGEIEVLSGVEISECSWYPDSALDVLSAFSFDEIIGSVHALRFGDITIPFSRIDFSAFTDEDVKRYLTMYFDDILELIDNTDFDILAHLSVPLRYIVGVYKRDVDISDYAEQTDLIFRKIIEKGIALELNSSSFDLLGDLMPGKELIKRYIALGGRRVTLGSDAHKPENVGKGLCDSVGIMKELGLDTAYYYKQRKPVEYPIFG